MSLVKVTNSSLAKYCSLDASFISRLRRGRRNVVLDAPYLDNMAQYIARNVKTEIQKETLISLINKPLDFTNYESVTDAILTWLTGRKNKSLVDAIESYKDEKFSFSINDNYIQDDILNVTSSVAFGGQGKREIVIKFLKEVLSANKKTTLYLYSDEDMSWLTEDESYLSKWASLLVKVIQKGNNIVIVHTIERSFDEMINAIMQWVPLYLTGSIEPYYYPRRRDGLIKRTMFIAKDISVVTSTSISQNRPVNMYFSHESIVSSIEEEFLNFLKKCKPLMRIYKKDELNEFLDIFNEFESENSLTYMKSLSFSSLTLPKNLIEKLEEDKEISKDDKELLIDRKNKFEKMLTTKKYYETITLPDTYKLLNNRYSFLSDFITAEGTLLKHNYDKEDLITHLKYVIDLMEKNENFNLAINNQEKTPFILYIKEDIGLIVIKAKEPMIAFAVNESNLTAAFLDYFHKHYLNGYSKRKTVEKLKNVIKEIEKNENVLD
jgi:hypothetical protein